ncbi:MAG TPA: hypothetical protein DCG51_07715 [Erysipelotrichaceae bacterium]|nr:hypothetical protein [Erysipelotrichaceae bacterium]
MTTEETTQKLEEWKVIIDSAGSSGKPVQEWCKENGVNARKFYHWRKKLKEMEKGTQFFEVPDDVQPAVRSGSQDLILKYKQFSLVIPEGVDTAVLEKVIKVLSHA